MPILINGIPLNWSEEEDQKMFGKMFPNGLGKPVFGGTLDDIAPTITIDENYISPLWGSHVEKKDIELATENTTYQSRVLGNKTEKEKWYIAVKEHKSIADFEQQKSNKPDLQHATLQLHIIEHNNKKLYEFALGKEVQPVVDALSLQDFAMYAQEIVDLLPTYNLPLEAIKQAKILTISTNRQAKQDAVKLKQQEANKPTANPNATEETVNLFEFLLETQNGGKTLFGQQDTIITGRSKGFIATTKATGGICDYKSDFNLVTGDYPAIYAWDIGGIEKYINLVSFLPPSTDAEKQKEIVKENVKRLKEKIGDKPLMLGIQINELINFIKEVHKEGGINTICWHMNSPLQKDINKKIGEGYNNLDAKGNATENAKGEAIKAIFSDKPEDKTTKANFDKILEIASYFFHSLVTDDTTITNHSTNTKTEIKSYPIPVIFRPFHEPKTDLNQCFWWSNIVNIKSTDDAEVKKSKTEKNNTNAGYYKQLWQKLQKKFDENNVKNVLYSFCLQDEFIEAKYDNAGNFESFTPDKPIKQFIENLVPDKYDIIGFDAYQRLGLDKYHELTKDNFNHYIAVNYYKENDWLLGNASYKKFTKDEFLKRLTLQYYALKKLPRAEGKIYAIQEIGADFLNFNPNWFNDVLLEFLKPDDVKLAYFTTWRNADRGGVEDKERTLDYQLKSSIDFNNPEIVSLKEHIMKTGTSWAATKYTRVKEYYLPFLPNCKYPQSIEAEIMDMQKNSYNDAIAINLAYDYFRDYLLSEETFKKVEEGLKKTVADKKAKPVTVPPVRNPYIDNFIKFVGSNKIITLNKLKSIPR
jgi:hypothetical protein